MKIKQFMMIIKKFGLMDFDMSLLKYYADMSSSIILLSNETVVTDKTIYFHFYNQDTGNLQIYPFKLYGKNSDKMKEGIHVDEKSVIIYIFTNMKEKT